MSGWQLLGLALVGALALMAAVWLLSLRLRNAGIVDVAWSLSFAPIAWLYAWGAAGWEPRRALVAVLVTLWSVRLGLHLLARVRRWHPREDGRYARLREAWGASVDRRMLGFFALQGVLAALLSGPFLLAALDPTPRWHPLELAGSVLWLVAVVGEALADRQLAAFVADPANRGRTCRDGLWAWSRHPNYFFEWLAWCAFALLALPAPHGWLGLLSPALMLHFLLRVTGIPATEEQALRSRGDDYRRYQQTTSAFVPLPPRSTSNG